jgi:hypothetical protein
VAEGEVVQLLDHEVGTHEARDAAEMGVGAALGQPRDRRVRGSPRIDQQTDPMRAATVRGVQVPRVHRTRRRRAGRVVRLPPHQGRQQFEEPEVVERQVEGQEDLQIIHQDGAGDQRPVHQQAEDVIGEQVGLAHAQGRVVGLGAVPVRRVLLDLVAQVEQGLGLHVHRRRRVGLPGVQIDPGEEELLQLVQGSGPPTAPRVPEHLVEVLGGAVVARVPRVAEAVCEPVQWAGGSHGLVRLAPVDQIEEVIFDPPLEHLRVLVEADEPLLLLDEELLHDLVDGHVASAPHDGHAAVVTDALEQAGQDAAHL